MNSIYKNLIQSYNKVRSKIIKFLQNIYCFFIFKSQKNIIIFLTPGDIKINGGVLSIFSLASRTRDLMGQKYRVQICTYPNHLTYLRNGCFRNREFVVSFDNLLERLAPCAVNKIIIHIPEYYSRFFFGALTSRQREKLRLFKDLRINILNQNIKQLPEIQDLSGLKNLSNKISITCSHSKFCNQLLSNKYQFPVHLFSVQLRSQYHKVTPFNKKKKQIILSPDDSTWKQGVIDLLRMNLPDWKLITIKNCKYEDYLKLVSESYFTVSFGEGFDSYFIQPFFNNSVGISVYNANFFPDKDWLRVKTVFSSDEDLLKNLIPTISSLLADQDKYSQLQNKVKEDLSALYSTKRFENNLRSFYEDDFNYYPHGKK